VPDTPRHGRLPTHGPIRTALVVVASALAVVLVSTVSVVGIAAWQLSSSFQPGVDIQADGVAPVQIGPIDEPVNILIVGSDSGEGNPAYGERGENLNDVTILLHLSPVSKSAVAVSFQRDLFVPIAGCENGSPGTRKINEALYYGGLACAVTTVEGLTGLEIGYAAKVEFDGVIALSNAVGGVEVCVAEAIHDSQLSFDLEAGMHTLQGWEALQFLRSRYGVGGVTPRIGDAKILMDAIAADAQIVVTGDPGGGAQSGEEVVETPTPAPSGSASPSGPPQDTTVVELPPSINGQPASEQTCTIGNNF
jgi:LCP family protein required for cell wall assembly